MTSRVAAAFAIVLGLALVTPAIAGPAIGPPEGPHPAELQNRSNTSNILRLPETNQSGVDRTDLDLSTALSMQWDAGRSRIDRGALDTRFQAAANESERLAVLLAALDVVRSRIDSAVTAEQRARDRYLAGTLSSNGYLTRLGELDARARETMLLVERIESLSDSDSVEDSEALTFGLLRAEARLALLIGPLRSELSDGVSGAGHSPTTYVGASPVGVTLSTVLDDRFVHETTRYDNFASDEPGTVSDAGDALDRWAELYPTVWDPTLVDFTGLKGAYRASLSFSGGELVTYLDATTLEVYREVQSKDLPGPPLNDPVSESRDGLEVSVNPSYPGGPLLVTFTTSDGTTPDGAVRINGVVVGSTGADGLLWAVTPSGQFTVTVDFGDRRVTVVVPSVTAA